MGCEYTHILEACETLEAESIKNLIHDLGGVLKDEVPVQKELEPYVRLARQIVDDVESVHPSEPVDESWYDMWENYLHACAMLGCEPMKPGDQLPTGRPPGGCHGGAVR